MYLYKINLQTLEFFVWKKIIKLQDIKMWILHVVLLWYILAFMLIWKGKKKTRTEIEKVLTGHSKTEGDQKHYECCVLLKEGQQICLQNVTYC